MSLQAPETPLRRSRPRRLAVLASRPLSARTRRITLGGVELNGFPPDCGGAHLKLFIPPPGRALLLPDLGPDGPVWPLGERPATRTFSVRAFHADPASLDIDFVLHEHDGPASLWARHARTGDELGLAGPTGPPLFCAVAEFHLMAGDLCALPAIAASLERLPATARGAVFIEIASDDDRQDLIHPRGVSVHWLRRRALGPSPLPEAIRAVTLPADLRTASATVAGENAAVVAIRRELLYGCGLPRHRVYAVPYWRAGNSEEQYHAERHRIMDEDA